MTVAGIAANDDERRSLDPGCCDGGCDGIPCPDSSQITTTMTLTFAGAYRSGERRDIVTVVPGGSSETLESNGIRVDIQFLNGHNQPLAGIPRQEMILFNSGLLMCPGGTIADTHTDLQGRTSFTGALSAGGCVTSLRLYTDGVEMTELAIRTNSPDLDANGAVDAGDVGALAMMLGSRVGDANYTICGDWNEDGVIDASEVAAMASYLGRRCP
jgi:hypothetical protein